MLIAELIYGALCELCGLILGGALFCLWMRTWTSEPEEEEITFGPD